MCQKVFYANSILSNVHPPTISHLIFVLGVSMSFSPNRPFQLPNLPPNVNFREPDLLDLVIEARSQLAELKGYSFSLPNPLILLSPAIVKESVASSEVENIHTTVIQALENQIFSEEERREPDREVLKYRDADLLTSAN
mgnify:CR=1 FL=1